MNAPDLITDFRRGQGDRINLQALDANEGLDDDQAFTFIGQAEYAHRPGELGFTIFGDDIIIGGDTNAIIGGDARKAKRSNAIIGGDTDAIIGGDTNAIIGGDTLGRERAKPAPDMLHEMVRRCGGGRAVPITA